MFVFGQDKSLYLKMFCFSKCTQRERFGLKYVKSTENKEVLVKQNQENLVMIFKNSKVIGVSHGRPGCGEQLQEG